MRTLVQISVSVGSAAAVAGLLAACGGSTAASNAAASTPTAGASGNAAYLACLQQHGVTPPSGFAGGRPTGARPTGARPSGGFGGGGGFGGQSQSPQQQAAAQACASVRPSGGFGGGGGTQLTAFRNCMTQQGVPVPTARPTAAPTSTSSAARYLNGLNPSDPKVAAALKVCEALLPSGSPGAQSTGSATSG